MRIKCIRNEIVYNFILVENVGWKECEGSQYIIIDVDREISILSCSFCYLQVILEEKKIIDYTILEVA